MTAEHRGSRPDRKPRRPAAANVLTAIVALVFALAQIEFAMAWLGYPQPPSNVSRVEGVRKRSKIPGLTNEFVPHTRWVHEFDSDPRGYFGDGVEYAINSFGARDREYPRAKPPGTLRVAVMGDSFTFGTGVHVEDTFAKRLESMLAERGEGPRTEVINFGVPGHDTRSEVVLLEHRALSFDPDVVLIAVFLNDAGGDIDGRGFGTAQNVDSPRWEAWLYRRSRIARAVAIAAEKRAVARRLVDSYLQSFRDDSPGWQQVRSALQRAADLQRTHDFQLVGVIWPVMYSLDDDYPFVEIHEKLARTFRDLGVPVVDLLPVFLGKDAGDLWVHQTNQHPNETAHAIAARAILSTLEEDRVLAAR